MNDFDFSIEDDIKAMNAVYSKGGQPVRTIYSPKDKSVNTCGTPLSTQKGYTEKDFKKLIAFWKSIYQRKE